MITHTYIEQHVKQVDGLDKYKADYNTLKHKHGQSMDDFCKPFHAQVQVCKDVGLQLYDQSLLDQITTDNGRVNQNNKDTTEAATAMHFIWACGNTNYKHHLKNEILDGEDIFPEMLADARDIMIEFWHYTFNSASSRC